MSVSDNQLWFFYRVFYFLPINNWLTTPVDLNETAHWLCFRPPAFERVHARDLRRFAGTSQKHDKVAPGQVGQGCTSRSLKKHSLGEGKPLWKEVCHFSNGKFDLVIPTIDMLRGVSYVRIYLRPYAQKSRRRELTWSSRKFLKPCDVLHREVITSISDVLIPECIMLCKARQRNACLIFFMFKARQLYLCSTLHTRDRL